MEQPLMSTHTGEIEEEWVKKQRRVFTRYMDVSLKKRAISLGDESILSGGLDDGSVLWNFCEIVSGKLLKKITLHPKFPIQKLENLNVVLEFLHSDGLPMVGIGAEDLLERKTKLVLGLVWQIIYCYQIKPQNERAKKRIAEKNHKKKHQPKKK